MTNSAAKIIDKFGGLSALAKALGHKNPTTVQGWKDRGLIPQRHWDAIIAAGKKARIKITFADLVAYSAPRKSRAA